MSTSTPAALRRAAAYTSSGPRKLCGEHGFEPATSVATVIWDDDEWPAGDDVVTLVNAGWARHVPDRLRTVTLEPVLDLPIEVVWREDDDSPCCGRSSTPYTTP